MEVQLEALNERVASRQPDIPGVTLIEAQVRQLVARMDQTGAQLSTLAKLYAESEERDASIDYEALADLVMNKTEEALARLEPPPALDVDALATLVANRTQEKLAYLETPTTAAAAVPQGLSDEGLAELETRMSRVFRSAAVEKEPEDLTEMQDGIRKVDERLGRLEDMLNRINSEQKVLAAEVAAPRPAPAPAPAPIAAAAPAAASVSYPLRDNMPIAPAVERPLVEQPYPDPVRSALEARNGPTKRHPGLESDDPPSFSELSPLTPEMLGGPLPRTESPLSFDPPAFDPEAVELPPRPESAFDVPDRDVFSSGSVPDARNAAPSRRRLRRSSRNTFMEAQRRAMQRHNQPKAPASGNSLLSRALARFQNQPVADEKDKKAAAPRRCAASDRPEEAEGDEAGEGQGRAGGDRRGRPASLPTSIARGRRRPRMSIAEKRESFLSRHRQPILLALSVVALSFLTLNLINQRMSGEQDTVPEPAAIVRADGDRSCRDFPEPGGRFGSRSAGRAGSEPHQPSAR